MKQLVKDLIEASQGAYSNFLAIRSRQNFNTVTHNSEVFNAVKGSEDYKEDESGDLSDIENRTKNTRIYYSNNEKELATHKRVYTTEGRLEVVDI